LRAGFFAGERSDPDDLGLSFSGFGGVLSPLRRAASKRSWASLSSYLSGSLPMNRPSAQTKYIGQCIYCPNPGTTKEHVVPIAFDGYHILDDGTCDDCKKITGDIETALCVDNFDALRFHKGYRGRRRNTPGKRQPDMKVMTTGGTRLEPKFRKVGADRAPGVTLFPVYSPPGLLVGRPDDADAPMGIQSVIDTSGDGAERQKALMETGIERSLAYASIDSTAFGIMLAKIAHGYAVFNVGLAGFIPLLPSVIKGENPSLFRYVGGTHPPMPTYIENVTEDRPYRISVFQCENGGQQYLGAQILLFATVRPLTPIYTVIFGQPAQSA
jgi:hypothetical protein